MGVRRAVDAVLDIAQRAKGRRIYTYGPLIHNPQTIELLKSRGITAVESVEEITDPQNSYLIVRAHGIAPEERKKSGKAVSRSSTPPARRSVMSRRSLKSTRRSITRL